MALVDLDRELYNRTIKELKEELEGGSHQLLLEWILREHKIEVDQLKAEVEKLKEQTEVQTAVTAQAIIQDVSVDRLLEGVKVPDFLLKRKEEPLPAETPEDIPYHLRPKILDEAEAMKRVQEMLDEEDAKPAETVDRSDTSGEHVDEEPAESTDERPKNWMQKNPIGPLNPAPIVTVEPEPFKPEGPVSGEERDRIARLIGVQNTGLAGETFCRIVTLRLEGKKPSEIADAIGLAPHLMGPQMRATERHVKQIAVHPREEWREEYLRQLALACQRRAA